MTNGDDIDMEAAEYVLGTLDAPGRVAIAARRTREPRLDAAIRDWERRLAPLDAQTPAVAPPPGLFPAIEQRIAALTGKSASGAEVVALRRRVARWKWATAVTSALAACLALAVVFRDAILPPAAQTYVAVFNKEDAAPSFVMSIDLASRQLTIRPVGAPREPGKTYQLWIAAEQFGNVPRSLGLMDDGGTITRHDLTVYDRGLLQNATFGVSLEPAGGSPTGRPTSPALHARLIPRPQ
jgi:anti-sigma-K factor RskA